jgi:hypothetical protein
MEGQEDLRGVVVSRNQEVQIGVKGRGVERCLGLTFVAREGDRGDEVL